MDLLTFMSKLIDSVAWPTAAVLLGLMFKRRILELMPTIKKFKAGPLEFEMEIRELLLEARQVSLQQAAETASREPSRDASVAGETASREPSRDASVAGETASREPSKDAPDVPISKVAVDRFTDVREAPAERILNAWASIDGELHKLGRQVGDIVDPLESTLKVYKWAISSAVLPESTRKLLVDVRRVRDEVAAGRATPTAEAATDYSLTVERTVRLIRDYRKNLSGYGPANQ